MSADNYVAVLRKADNEYVIVDGNESANEEDCQYVGHVVAVKYTRPDALVAAHDHADKLPILEYGVTEGNYPAIGDFCGRCYTCINDREIVADDVERCTKCNEPIVSGDWRVMKDKGIFHRRCEPGRPTPVHELLTQEDLDIIREDDDRP